MSAGSGGSAVVRAARAFGRFWWEFLIGDTPELFFAVLGVIGLSFAFRGLEAAGVPIVIAAVLGSLGLSAWRGRRRDQQS